MSIVNATMSDQIAELRAEIARLRAGIEEYACTGTDHPCGCHTLLTADKAEIERLRAVLLPFALLCRPYDHQGAADDDVVRSNGTFGKTGDRGYAHITVADLRRARDILNAVNQQERRVEP